MHLSAVTDAEWSRFRVIVKHPGYNFGLRRTPDNTIANLPPCPLSS